MIRWLVALALVLVLTTLTATAGPVYRWLDADGKVHYTNTPPPAGARQVSEPRLPAGKAGETPLPWATQEAIKRFPVVLYTAAKCPACEQGRELLVKRGVPFSEKRADTSAEDGALLEKLIGERSVPVLQVGKHAVKGFLAESWQAALDAAGYPKQGPQRPPAPGQPAEKPAQGGANTAPEGATESPAEKPAEAPAQP